MLQQELGKSALKTVLTVINWLIMQKLNIFVPAQKRNE